MRGGVTMPDPSAVYLDAGVTVGADTVLLARHAPARRAPPSPAGCTHRPRRRHRRQRHRPRLHGRLSAHVLSSELEEGRGVGPSPTCAPAPGWRGARAGTYVELKNTELGAAGQGAAPLLRRRRHGRRGARTSAPGTSPPTTTASASTAPRIGARVKTGSDCVFVAPVSVGDDAMTGAGSIITDDVPDGALGIARARQSVIEGFTREGAAARARAAAEAKEGAGEHEHRPRRLEAADGLRRPGEPGPRAAHRRPARHRARRGHRSRPSPTARSTCASRRACAAPTSSSCSPPPAR